MECGGWQRASRRAAALKVGLSQLLQFTPQQPGHYAFRLRVQDVAGNTAQSYVNVEVPDPALPAAHLSFTIR